MARVIKFFVLVMLILSIAYLGTCVYANIVSPQLSKPKIPDAAEAMYSLSIRNTGNVLLVNSYEQSGGEPGNRVFILTGYWEMVGQSFKYRDLKLVLDERIFGEITIRRRQ